jgi:UPF0755 protein
VKTRVVILLVLLGLGARLWWRVETESPSGGPVAEITIPPGTSTQAIASMLQQAGVIKRPWSFAFLVRLRGEGKDLKAGRYKFEGPYSLLDVEQKIARGDVERREITFPEGRNVFEMAEIVTRVGLSGERFLAAAQNATQISDLDPKATSLEGYLFPETYDIVDGTNAQGLVSEMVKVARDAFLDLGLTPAGRTIGGLDLSLREIITLASIVELETAAPDERPRIAGVFLNRLRIGMRLQTDPTVIYALKLEGTYKGNIRKVDLSSESPYNTYRFAGLPPGPIGSPGRSALRAVLEPEVTDALYFVSRNDGTHVFSKSLRDHENAVDEFQRRRSGRRPRPVESPAEAPK